MKPARTPRHRCDKFPCAVESCEHYRSPLEVELTDAVRALVASKLPPGTRVRMGESPFWEVRVTCGGQVPIQAYTCCMKPGHAGQCYCEYKGVYFNPERY